MRYHWDTLIHDAGQMGRLVITEKLAALGNKPITAFRAWNDGDDARAKDIMRQAAKFAPNRRKPQFPKGANAAHLLAGATMAAYDDPDAFDSITAFLNRALDEVAAKDEHLRL